MLQIAESIPIDAEGAGGAFLRTDIALYLLSEESDSIMLAEIS